MDGRTNEEPVMALRIFDEKSRCCGCATCRSVCPESCIRMEADDEGFLYPVIDQSRCTACGLCLAACPGRRETNASNFQKSQYFSARNKDDGVIMASSSGGVFSALAHFVLGRRGVVYGCAYDETMKAVHICVENAGDLKRLRGSKYVQSDMQECHDRVKKHVEDGRHVLFTGTPCQVAGLKTFLGHEPDNLLLADVLCHGVPSPLYFRKFLDHLGKKHRGRVVNYEFRNKRRDGWGSEHRSYYEIEKNGRIRGCRPVLPAYFCAFFWGLNLRPSCYECRYAFPRRNSDLTMGDFWGYFDVYRDYFPKGISVISVNSEKGETVRNRLASVLDMQPLSFGQAVRGNENFSRPTRKPWKRDVFYRGFRDKPYRALNRRVFLHGTPGQMLTSLKGRFVPEKVRRAVRSIMGKKPRSRTRQSGPGGTRTS